MLPSLSPYSQQGMMPQFPGLQTGLQDFTQSGLGHNPFTQGQFQQNPFAFNPQLHSQLSQGFLPQNNPSQQILALLGQVAQQLSIQSAITQQIGVALQQVTQQLAAQSQQSFSGGGPGGGQYGGGQYYAQNPFGTPQGGLAGFNPQAQAWGANRSQTIQ